MSRTREPQGIPTGGRFATEHRSEADVALTAPDIAVRDEALARYGLDLDFDDRFADAWDETFGVLRTEKIPTVEDEIRDMMGHPDFGRERRAPTFVWHTPGNPGDDVVVASSLEQPAGTVPLVNVYTRNGGGNRECWHSGDHEDGCTGCIVGDLQDRADYSHDMDDDFDPTYADFYFHPNDLVWMLRAARTEESAQQQKSARLMLERIERGEQPPWDVLPVNPATAELLADTREQARRKHIPSPSGLHSAGLKDHHLEPLDVVVKAAQEGEYVQSDSATVQVAARDLCTAMQAARDAQEKLARWESTRAMIDDGSLSADVVAVLDDIQFTSYHARRRDYADSRTALVNREVRALASYRDHLAAAREQDKKVEAATERVGELTRALRWPGDPDTVPKG